MIQRLLWRFWKQGSREFYVVVLWLLHMKVGKVRNRVLASRLATWSCKGETFDVGI